MGPARRGELVFEMSDELRSVSLGGLRERNPHLGDAELVIRLIELWHGPDLAERCRSTLSEA